MTRSIMRGATREGGNAAARTPRGYQWADSLMELDVNSSGSAPAVRLLLWGLAARACNRATLGEMEGFRACHDLRRSVDVESDPR